MNPFESSVLKTIKQKIPGNGKLRIGIIPDTQDYTEAALDHLLTPLKNRDDLTAVIHLGDLTATGILSKYAKQTKRDFLQYDREKYNNQLSPEMLQYENTIQSGRYKQFYQECKKFGTDHEVVIYSLWIVKEEGSFDGVLDDIKTRTDCIVRILSAFKSKVFHLLGNADRAFPEKLDIVRAFLKNNGIDSVEQPSNVPINDNVSFIFWPSAPVNGSDQSTIDRYRKIINELVQLNKNKASVCIFCHETPFKGPKAPGVYERRIEASGLSRSERVPYKQFLPISRGLMELCRCLPTKVKVSVVCGHMHDPREIIAAGTQYLQFNAFSAKLRLFGIAHGSTSHKRPNPYDMVTGERRTIDLYYIPQGETGVIDLDVGTGAVIYRPLI